jgi:4-amino-4-deoxy-L-arabinose transferase-like glycosyltransferase
VDGGALTSEFFWQPFFYPFILSKIYSLCSGSILTAKIIQMILGSLTCVLVWQIGRKIASNTVGLFAGIITSFYGPLIFFDGELLATGWAALFSAALILAFLKARETKKMIFCFAFGIIAGISVITRPTFLPFVFIAIFLYALMLRKENLSWNQSLQKTAVKLAGFILITAAVSVQSLATTGRFTFLPRSGPINLYVGNNQDTSKTLGIRPSDWKDITRLPSRHGSSNTDKDMYYLKKQFRDQKTIPGICSR